MSFLDIRTIVFTNMITFVICSLVIILLWLNSRKRFSGIGFLAIDAIALTFALLLISLRGHIPNWMSIVLSNTLVISGTLMSYIGLEIFINKRSSQIHNYAFLIIFICIHSYFTFVEPDLTNRTLNISAGLIILCSQCAFLMLYRAEPHILPMTFSVGMIYGAYALINLVRVAGNLIIPHTNNDFFKSGSFDTFMIIVYNVLFILLTYHFTLMVNKRLFMELQTQEEKFSKAFHSSPYAITLTRVFDGKIFEVNDAFETITGYSSSEILGKTTFELNLWYNPQDREYIVDELSKNGTIRHIELKFRKKSDEIMTGLFSADIISVDNQKTVISSINDITEQKLVTERIQKLLQEKELILKEVHHRIKNNMNTIFSLLMLQSYAQTYTPAEKALQDAATRVQSMMLLYDKLYRSKNINTISIKEYLLPLINDIVDIFPLKKSVKIKTNIEDIPLDADLLSSLGIIINELITNSMKYAFPNEIDGLITISVSKKDDRISIIFEDNGVGIPDAIDTKNPTGFGMQLIDMLVQQIHGSMNVKIEKGTKFTIEFKASNNL